MGFLRYTLHLIDFLAWPVLALGYPLFASIRAIEAGSKYHMRKLVTYWTIFSFISLFEHAFEKLIEWVPVWPYIKLITICWLVIQQFNGACYLYQNLIRPCFPLKLPDTIRQFNDSRYVYQLLLYLCLSVNLQTVTDWFNKPMEDPSLKTETFLAVAQRYLEENGSDALEKLIADKRECEGSHPVWEDIKVTEHMAKHEAAETKRGYPIPIEKKTTGVQVKEMTVPADAEEIRLPRIISSKQVQTEWTCAVCQVTATSEQILKSHLNGRKHKAKSEGLKTCQQTAKSEGSSPVTTNSNQLNQEKVKHEAAARSEHVANEAAEPKQITPNQRECEGSHPVLEDIKVMEHMAKREAADTKQGSPIPIEKKTTGVQVKEMTVPADAEEIRLPRIISSKQVQTEWTCAVCQVTATSEQILKSHLNGRKHKAKSEGLKTCQQTAKSEGSSPVTTNSNQLNQEKVKHEAAARSEHVANEAAEPKQITPNQRECEGSHPVLEDIKVMEHMAKREAADTKQGYPIPIEKKTTGVQVKEMTVPADAEEIRLPRIISSKQVQTEWTCAVCQVTATSEQILKSHLNGRKHKAKSEGLKTCQQTAKSEGSSPVTTNSNQLNQEKVKHEAAARSEHVANEAAEPKQITPNQRECEGSHPVLEDIKVMEHMAKREAADTKQGSPIPIEKKTTGVQVKEMTVPADAEEIRLPRIISSKQVQTEWTCAVCQVTATSEQILKSHLNGRKHKAKSEGLKTCQQTAKSEGSSPVTTNSNQLNQEKVKHEAAARSEHVANEAAEPKQITPNQRECEGSHPVLEDIKVMEHMAKREAADTKQGSPIPIEKKTTGVQVKEMTVPADAEEIRLPRIISSKQVQTEWTCAVCQVTATSEQILKSHLNGRKHKAKSEGLKTCQQTAKSEGSSPVTTNSNQLNQEKVKHEAAARSEHVANEAAEPKQRECEGSHPVLEDIKVMEHMAKREAADTKQGYPIPIEKKTTGVQVKEMTVPADAEEIRLPRIISSKQVQTEWTCAVCQVTATSEQILKSHLNGRKHKAKSEGLKTCQQTAKSEGSSPVTTNPNQLNQEKVKHEAAARSEHVANEAAEPKQITPNQRECEGSHPVLEDIKVMEHMAKREAADTKQGSPIPIEKKMTGVQVKEMTVPADAEEIRLPRIISSKQVQTEWTCAVCQVTATSEQILKSHLNGRKHKAKSEGLKTCQQTAKSEGSSPVTTNSNQLNQEKVKHEAAARSEHVANEAAEPKQITPNQRECEGSHPVLEDIKVMEHMAKREAADTKQGYPIPIEKKTTGVQVKEMTVPADAEEIRLPRIISSKQVQTEWTCAVCQVTATSEQILKSHLNGRKHKAKSEGLKTCQQTAKSEGSSPVTTNSNQLNQEKVKHEAAARSEHVANEAAEPKQGYPIPIEKKTTGVQVKEMTVPADAEEIRLPRIISSKQVQTEWTCAVCQVTATSEQILKSHLNGRKHKAKSEGLKTCQQTAKSEGSSPVTTNSNQLNQEKVKHEAAARSEHVANEAAEPKQRECEGSHPVWEDIKVTEHTAKHEAAETKQGSPIPIEKKTTGVQVKEMTVPADAEEIRLPRIISSKQVQTEWTCAVCQVTATSEQILKSHLNGRKHKAKSEGLKTCQQTAKSEGSSPVTTNSNQLNQEKVKHEAAARSEHVANEAAEPKQIEKKATAVQMKETALPADAEEIKLPETNAVKKVQTEWTCAVCQVTTKSEHDLKCHLLWRHEEKCEELKTCKKTAKTERNPPITSNMPDKLKQEQVKLAPGAQRKHSTNEKPKEKVQLGAAGQHRKQEQLRNAGGATHNSKLWCSFCSIKCLSEIDMASHLSGRKHLAKLQEMMSFTG
ncbi:uncharacterized protein LOC132606445 isoform X6 [Lycium barbarum]|uniref:uncharacterized protein LOC132606445 isoform X6 n=1 Tax=Lycium barbarum TaxID=112863 RepID=UPI00293F6244|nr:uncharacterized protein LOC132606445 isoform X6 [Lycium barbarum]